MTITVDPSTFVIMIPISELILVQSVPTVIYDMDINDFRLALKNWEDDQNNGITFLKTHTHNTEITLGGLTFARVVELLSPYTITFEDGQYAVNLTGANSNIGDRVNVNQVSVRSQNSAGLISSPDIEYSSFNGGVTVDINSGNSGTVFPRGTDRMKVDNLADAVLIADYRGFNTLYIDSDMSISDGTDLNYFTIQGSSYVNTQIILEDSAQLIGNTIQYAEITGVLDGGTTITNCVITDLNFFNGHIRDSALAGTITLAGSLDAFISNCSILNLDSIPTIDMGTSGQDLVMPNYTGIVVITNLNGSNKVGIALNSGFIRLDSATVVSGNITVSGVGSLTDENEVNIPSGLWNGGVTIKNELLSKSNIAIETVKRVVPFIYGR